MEMRECGGLAALPASLENLPGTGKIRKPEHLE